MTELTQTTTSDNIATVESFLYALQNEDLETADVVLADDLLYENVGYTRMRGGRKLATLFRRMQGRVGFDLKIHRIAADGDAVLTERTDALIFGPFRIQFWVCGTFELRDGQITLWRDYFDTYDVLKAIVRGLVGAVVPSLRTTL